MPVVDAAIIADVRAKIDAEFPAASGLLPAEASQVDAGRQKLAICIAEAGIYDRDNLTIVVPNATPGSTTLPSTVT